MIPCSLASKEIILNHYGFGKNPNEAKFTIHSSGDEPVSNITIYVDSKEYARLEITLFPKKGVTKTVILNPGEHIIEAKTAEGAYDSETVFVSSVGNETREEEKTLVKDNNTITIITIMIIILLAAALW